jgi:hypothetical protein
MCSRMSLECHAQVRARVCMRVLVCGCVGACGCVGTCIAWVVGWVRECVLRACAPVHVRACACLCEQEVSFACMQPRLSISRFYCSLLTASKVLGYASKLASLVDFPFVGSVAESASQMSELLKSYAEHGHYPAPDASRPPTRTQNKSFFILFALTLLALQKWDSSDDQQKWAQEIFQEARSKGQVETEDQGRLQNGLRPLFIQSECGAAFC